MSMKKLATLSAILMLALGASLAAAQTPQSRSSIHFSNPMLNEVVRMSNAGMRSDTIIAYVRARESRLDAELTADDLIELRRAGVDESVIQYLAGASAYAGGGSRYRGAPNIPNDQGVDYSNDSGDGETVPVQGQPYYGYGGWGWGYPYWGWGWGWGWPYYGSVAFGFSHGHFHGGHGGGGHGGHGGHH